MREKFSSTASSSAVPMCGACIRGCTTYKQCCTENPTEELGIVSSCCMWFVQFHVCSYLNPFSLVLLLRLLLRLCLRLRLRLSLRPQDECGDSRPRVLRENSVAVLVSTSRRAPGRLMVCRVRERRPMRGTMPEDERMAIGNLSKFASVNVDVISLRESVLTSIAR